MATYLFAWELGLGLGHLVNLRPLVDGLAQRGHRVHLALRELDRAAALFPQANVELWQAPFKSRQTGPVVPTLSFPQLMAQAGFGSATELRGLGEGWRSLFRATDPDAIVFDHSPAALVAVRGFRARRVTLGTGFFLPPDTAPLPTIQPWLRPDPAQLAADEVRVLDVTNEVLASWQLEPLPRVASLYHPAEEHLLVTFPELDHYGTRPGVRYWGAWTSGFGKTFEWPGGSRPRIYAYLKPFRELPTLLALLARSGSATVIYSDGISPPLQQQFSAPTVRFESEPLDMAQVACECDLAIMNGNHGTAVALLLAGKPSLQIPIHVEQSLLATAMMRMGAALGASPDSTAEIEQQLARLLSSDLCRSAAQQFATRYAGFDQQAAINAIVARLEQLGTSAV